MTNTESFSKVIQFLKDEEHPFPAYYLHRFSDLSSSDLNTVLKVWSALSTHRKLTLLEDLENLADSDTLMSFEALARSLLADDDPAVRVRAISLLWECTDVKLIPVYLSILNHDEDINVRAEAASILGKYIYIGELEEIPSNLLRNIEENLLAATINSTPDLVRRRAVEALGASSREEVPSLIESAYHHKGMEWKVSALHAMGRSSDEHWEKYILAHLFDQEEDISSEAINAAGKLELDSARAPLLDLLADEEDTEIRREIIWALSCIGGEGVKAILDELLDLEDEDEADFLEEALENLLFTEELDQFSLLEFDTDSQDDDSDLPD
jgi:HEAT repeat protein